MPQNAEPEIEGSEFRLGINTYRDDYPTCNKTYVTLVFYGEAHPSSITELLGIEPEKSRTKGELLGNSRTALNSNWHFSSEGYVGSKDSLHHIDWLLQKLNGKGDAIRALQEQGWDARLWVFWDSASGHGGPTLTPYSMKRLAELNLVLYFDVYYSSEDEEE